MVLSIKATCATSGAIHRVAVADSAPLAVVRAAVAAALEVSDPTTATLMYHATREGEPRALASEADFANVRCVALRWVALR